MNKFKRPEFKMGQLFMTCGIRNFMSESNEFSKEVQQSFNRYCNKDWGELCDEDKFINDSALMNGNERIVASYNCSIGNIFIITECDRSMTTIILSSEY